MTEPIKPATDEQVDALKAGVGSRTWRNVEDVAASMTVDILIARIESDAAKLKERDEQIAELVAVLSGLVKINTEWNAAVEKTIGRPPNWTDGYLDTARDILARRKEADRG